MEEGDLVYFEERIEPEIFLRGYGIIKSVSDGSFIRVDSEMCYYENSSLPLETLFYKSSVEKVSLNEIPKDAQKKLVNGLLSS